MFAIVVLLGSAAKNFDTSAVSVGPAGTITANRCSFFALEFASVIGFAAIGADFYVYYPTTTSKWITFLTTWSGTWLALIFCNIVGIGIATGVAGTPAWNEAYGISSGALLLECYHGLGGFGGFCVVILALGSVTNNAPCTYAAALTIQVLGRYAKAIPRWVWCVFITLIELVCSVAGRNHLFNIFENFLPIMSYWVCPWILLRWKNTSSFTYSEVCRSTGRRGRTRRGYLLVRRRCLLGSLVGPGLSLGCNRYGIRGLLL